MANKKFEKIPKEIEKNYDDHKENLVSIVSATKSDEFPSCARINNFLAGFLPFTKNISLANCKTFTGDD